MKPTTWKLNVAASAERSLERLPSKVAAAIVELLVGPLVESPRAIGHPLQRELSGPWSARRGAYRVLYDLDETTATVNVVRIEHRSDVYRPR